MTEMDIDIKLKKIILNIFFFKKNINKVISKKNVVYKIKKEKEKK